MTAALSITLAWNLYVVPAWVDYQDTQHYGTIRTSHLTVSVEDRNKPSYFTAVNQDGRLMIFEVVAGSVEHTHVYTLPMLLDSKAVVTLEVQHHGATIMILVHIENDNHTYALVKGDKGLDWLK